MTVKLVYVGGTSRNDLDARFNERGRTPQDYGAVGDGTTDDTAALQDWLDAVAVSGRGILPNGIYAHDGSLTLAGDNIVVEFEDNAWLAPTAGWGLKTATARTKLVNPRILFTGASTATRGLWINQSTRTVVENPTIWAEVIPASVIGIDVDNNSYWCTINTPHIRKDSAAVTGTFPVGVRFRQESNAGRVIGGDISHCDDGVAVDGSNGIRVIGVDFEDVTTGCALLEPTISGKNGAFLSIGNRFESVTYALDIRYTYAETQPIMHFANGYNGSLINNPNSQPLGIEAPGGIRILASGQSIEFGALAAIAARLKEASGSMTLEANGNVVFNADMDGNGSGSSLFNVNGVSIAKAELTKFSVYKEFAHIGSKVGFFNVPTVGRPAALTQTYSTSSRTLAAYTADAESTAYTGQDNAQAGTVYAKLDDLNALRTAYENLRAHHESLAKFVNAVVDDLQTLGLEQ